MCHSWTWTTAFNRGRHWSTALLMRYSSAKLPLISGRHLLKAVVQVHGWHIEQLLIWLYVVTCLVKAGPTRAHSVLEIIQTHDSLHRAAGYFCQLFNYGTFARPVFLTATRSIFCFVLTSSAVLYQPSERPSSLFVVLVLRLQKISNRTAHFHVFAPHHFSWRRSLIDNLSSFM